MSDTSINKKIIADNIKYYLNLRHISSVELCKALGFPESSFSSWINGRMYPRIDKIQAMADYFGITKADLVEEKKSGDGSGLSSARQQLLYAVEDMSEDEILHLLDVIAAVKGMR